jgi:hypothetical protein
VEPKKLRYLFCDLISFFQMKVVEWSVEDDVFRIFFFVKPFFIFR